MAGSQHGLLRPGRNTAFSTGWACENGSSVSVGVVGICTGAVGFPLGSKSTFEMISLPDHCCGNTIILRSRESICVICCQLP